MRVAVLMLVLVLVLRRYVSKVSERRSDYIAAAGMRLVVSDSADVSISADILVDQDLSLMARGLFAVLVAEQGSPVDPYDDAFESDEEIAGAIEELIAVGLAVRVSR